MLEQAAAIAESGESETRHDLGNKALNILRRWPDAAAHLFIIAVALVLAWHTWAHWGNFEIDCGRELYIPVEILRGKVLYRDLWYTYGPLEPYLSALLIGFFGRHLYVLYLFGLSMAIGSALLLFQIGSLLEGRAVGTVAALALLFQGFGGNGGAGRTGFNYIFPYSYAAALGALLSLLCAWATLRYVLVRDRHKLVLAGTFAGLALLSKQEFGGACCILLAFAISADAFLSGSVRAMLAAIAAAAPGVAIALAIYGWIFWTFGIHFMLASNWIGLPGTYFATHGGPQLYAGVGLRFVPREMAALTMSGAAVLSIWSLAGWLSARLPRRWVVAGGAVLALGALAARLFDPRLRAFLLILIFPPGLFFISLGFLAYSLYRLFTNADQHALVEAGFSIFALVLAVRVLAEVVPYGFSIFYDGPLFLIFIMILARCLAGVTPSVRAETSRTFVNGLLAFEIFLLGMCIIPGNSARTAKLETSWGVIYLRPREARVASQILAFIQKQKRQGHQVALLPELPIMYALTGTEAPSRWYTILPGYLSPIQTERFIGDLKLRRFDYILLTNRYTGEFGAPYFGIDYDRSIYQWIRKNYRVAGEFGHFHRNRSWLLTALIYERR